MGLLILLPLYLATATWNRIQSDDPYSAALAGWTLVTSGGLAFDSAWETSTIPWPAEGRDGRFYSNRFPGVIAVATVGYSAAALTGTVPTGRVAHPSLVPLWPATLMAVLTAVLAALLTWRMFRFLPVPPRFALGAAGVVALGSPLWSVSATALWTHGPTHALLVGGVVCLLGGRTGLAAVLGGGAVLFRPHLLVPLLVIAGAQERWRDRLTMAAGAGAGVALVAVYSLMVFGQPLPAAGYRVGHVVGTMPASSASALIGNLSDWLLDPNRGVLIFVPLIMVPLIKGRSAWRAAPRWVRTTAVAAAAYAIVQLGLMRASGGNYFFGHRTTIEALFLAAPLMVLSIHILVTEQGATKSARRMLVAIVAGLSIVIHAYGAVVDLPPGVDDTLELYHERRALADSVDRGLSFHGSETTRFSSVWTHANGSSGYLRSSRDC